MEQLTALLVIIGDDDHINSKPTSLAIIEAAKRAGLKGGTITKGLAGYGAHAKIHTSHIIALSDDLPVQVFIVDTEEKIQAFLPQIREMAAEGLICTWPVSGISQGARKRGE